MNVYLWWEDCINNNNHHKVLENLNLFLSWIIVDTESTIVNDLSTTLRQDGGFGSTD